MPPNEDVDCKNLTHCVLEFFCDTFVLVLLLQADCEQWEAKWLQDINLTDAFATKNLYQCPWQIHAALAFALGLLLHADSEHWKGETLYDVILQHHCKHCKAKWLYDANPIDPSERKDQHRCPWQVHGECAEKNAMQAANL